jgi:two-component system, NtrC family, response regulator HydG
MNLPTNWKSPSSSPQLVQSSSNAKVIDSSRCTVLLLDRGGLHHSRIETIIANCGARARWLKEFSEIGTAHDAAHVNVLLMALEDELSPNAPLLDAIHALKGAGFHILAFADGVKNWPIRTRCLPLVAGATNLLDISHSDFEPELARLLVQFVQAEARREEEERYVRETIAKSGMVGESPAMLALFRTILRISVLSDLPVLITGETGTGKELLAHAIHASDPKRRAGPFVAVNCGAISPGLAESELFGHRRGAFTGADRDRKGLIRSAHGGILFLDEVGELDDALQSKLLRMVQERTVLGVGEDSETAVDVRVVAATNRHLDQMVAEKKFREDLFYRLNVLSLHTPPLRERPADIEPLINYFLQKYYALGPPVPLSVHGDFLEALMEVGLPGNVRQLENIVRQTLVHKDNDTPLTLADLPAEVLQRLSKPQDRWQEQSQTMSEEAEEGRLALLPQRDLPSAVVKLFDANNWRLSRSLASCEKLLLEQALRKTHGNQSQTARLLGITSRSVYNKVRKYHLTSQ